MSTSYESGNNKPRNYSTNIIHYVVFLGILIAVSFFFQTYVVRAIVQGFVESQFKPEGGQVLATVEGARIGIKADEAGTANISNLKNSELIFDFTSIGRDEKSVGYEKHSNEWYVKAPAIGEHGVYLEPWGFSILSLDVGFILALIITLILPGSIGYIARKIDREIFNNKNKVRLQTGFSDETVELLTMPNKDLAKLAEEDRRRVVEMFRSIWNRTTPEVIDTNALADVRFEDIFDKDTDVVVFRNQGLYIRIKEHFSDFVEGGIEDIKHAIGWQKNHFKIGSALRLYMAHHFTERYSNNVTGFAYGGAAILIIAVGIRGLKFIPSSRPSVILFAILLEFSLLALLAVTLFYTEEEERMDKMLKKMEDASRSQLDVLQEQQRDIRTFVDKLIGESSDIIKRRVEEAISEHLSDNDSVKEKISEAIVKNISISFKETLGGAGSQK